MLPTPTPLSVETTPEPAATPTKSLAKARDVKGLAIEAFPLFRLAGTQEMTAQEDLGAIITGAGVVGVTVGLATQDLLKNVLAGVNILLEDHFGIGDVIEVGGVTGTVEAFHLRCTQIRTVDGRLVVVPNNNIVMVQNHSNGWGRVDFRVDVAYQENLDEALEALMDEATRLSEEWEDQVTEPPILMGVEMLGPNGVQLRLLLRTIPLSQWSVKRELNKRVKDRFDREGIEIPFPQMSVWPRSTPPQGSVSQETNVS